MRTPNAGTYELTITKDIGEGRLSVCSVTFNDEEMSQQALGHALRELRGRERDHKSLVLGTVFNGEYHAHDGSNPPTSLRP